MTFQRINPSTLGAPRGFSHAVATDRPRTIYLAGQTALDASGTIVGDGIVAQFEQALSNLLAALDGAGGAPSDLTTVTIYIINMDDYQAHASEIATVWRRLAGTEYPAMAGVGVSRLWDVEALVEIQGIAAVG
jgi:enamine deaminase RidA (YjgF/YER057c/UK114 family)